MIAVVGISAAYQYRFEIDGLVQVGREDGSPVYESVPRTLMVWFDEPAGAQVSLSDRAAPVPIAARRAIIWAAKDSGLSAEMEGVILGPDGESYGRWSVEIVRTVPGFAGVSHLEAEALGVLEVG